MLPYRENVEGRLGAGELSVFLNCRRTAGRWVEEHWHPCAELLCVFGGSARQRVNGAAFPLGVGDVLLIPPGAVHATHAVEDDCYIAVALFYQEEGGPGRYLPAGGCPGMERLFSLLQEESTLGRPGSPLVVRGLLLQILGLLERFGAPLAEPAPSPGEARRLEEYIRARLPRGVTLGEVAAWAGYSPAYLSRRFPRLMGMPFKKYVDQMKAQAARGMLADGVSVAETAAALGYETASSFSRAFKRITGQTPTGCQGTGQKMDSIP